MIRIPIVKKLTASYFIDVFGSEVKDNASLLSNSQVSTALDTSMAQYIPQSVFSRYLYLVLDEIGPSRFIELISVECHKLIEGLLTQNVGLDFLASYSMHNQIHCDYEGERVVVSMDSSYPLAKQTKLNLADEIMAVYFVMYAIQNQIKGKPAPFGIRLQSPNTPLLDSLNLKVPIYLEHDATQIVFDKACTEIKTLVDSFKPLEATSLSENIELAIESYIGRTAYSFEEYCELLEIHPRAMQRYLKEEGVTFRELKDRQNIKFAKRVLKNYEFSVQDLAIHLGYGASSQFIRAFKRLEGTTPLQWLKQQA